MNSKIVKILIYSIGLILVWNLAGLAKASAAVKETVGDQKNKVLDQDVLDETLDVSQKASDSNSGNLTTNNNLENSDEPSTAIEEPAVNNQEPPSLPEPEDIEGSEPLEFNIAKTSSSPNQNLQNSTISAQSSSGDVVINELMWMGSSKDSADEWIELRNLNSSAIDFSINNWSIYKNNSLMLVINSGILPANGFFLISNFSSGDVQSALNVNPDIINTAVSLLNSGVQYKLYDSANSSGNLIDTADDGSGAPLAGDNTNKYSMERNLIPADGTLAINWHTAVVSQGFDNYSTERGTPKSPNIISAPAPLINAASPNTINNNATPITIEILGENFVPVPKINIDSQVCQFPTFKNSQVLECQIPAGLSEGVYSITVINPDLQPDTLVSAFIIDLTPPSSTAESLKITNQKVISISFTALDNLSGIDFIELYYQKDDYGYQLLDKFQLASSPYGFDISQLGEGQYDFYTIATDLAGNIEVKNKFPDSSTVVDLTPPQKPWISNIISQYNQITLIWEPISDADFYQIYKMGSGFHLIATVPAGQNSFTDTDVVGGHIYVYRLQAVDLAGNISQALEIQVETPILSIAPEVILPKTLAKTLAPQPQILSSKVKKEKVAPKQAPAPEEEKVEGKETEAVTNWPLIIGIILAALVIIFWIYYWYISFQESKRARKRRRK